MHSITSCSHSALEHLLHPLCPEQSNFRKTANVVLPLFVILGAIYYAWRHFNPVIPSDHVEKINPQARSDEEKKVDASPATRPEESPEDTFNNQLKSGDLESARITMRGIVRNDPLKSDQLREQVINVLIERGKVEEACREILEL